MSFPRAIRLDYCAVVVVGMSGQDLRIKALQKDMSNEPSAVIWSWRREEGAGAEARAAAAARKRGLLGAVVGLVAAAVIHHFRPTAGLVVAGVALLFLAIALAAPLTLYPKVMGLLDRFAHAVGTAVTWVLMTVLYYLFFLPAGLLLKAGGKLGITTRPDRRLPSYWSVADERQRAPEAYRKQF
jgi:hypothetical protein